MWPRPTTSTRFLSRIRSLVPEAAGHGHEDERADEEDRGQRQGELGTAIEKIADRKERRPDGEAAGNPPQCRLAHVVAVRRGLRHAHAGLLANDPPAGTGGMHLPVERN